MPKSISYLLSIIVILIVLTAGVFYNIFPILLATSNSEPLYYLFYIIHVAVLGALFLIISNSKEDKRLNEATKCN